MQNASCCWKVAWKIIKTSEKPWSKSKGFGAKILTLLCSIESIFGCFKGKKKYGHHRAKSYFGHQWAKNDYGHQRATNKYGHYKAKTTSLNSFCINYLKREVVPRPTSLILKLNKKLLPNQDLSVPMDQFVYYCKYTI